jgi:hypothetical protein
VKFKLTGASSGVTNATVRLTLAKVVDGVPGNEFPATSNGSSNANSLFRYDAREGQYIFNLSTRELTAGTYQLRVDTGDGVSRTVLITLN